jgi:hypothetical protein
MKNSSTMGQAPFGHFSDVLLACPRRYVLELALVILRDEVRPKGNGLLCLLGSARLNADDLTSRWVSGRRFPPTDRLRCATSALITPTAVRGMGDPGVGAPRAL